MKRFILIACGTLSAFILIALVPYVARVGYRTDALLDINTGRIKTVQYGMFIPAHPRTTETWLSTVIDPEQYIPGEWQLIKQSSARINFRWARAWSDAQNIHYGIELDLLTHEAFEACCFALIKGWPRIENPRDLEDVLRELGQFVLEFDESPPATLDDVQPYLVRFRAEE